MIHKFRNQHPVARLCALVDVAKSGYQAWCTGKVTSRRKLEDMRLVVAINAAAASTGWPRATAPRRFEASCWLKASWPD